VVQYSTYYIHTYIHTVHTSLGSKPTKPEISRYAPQAPKYYSPVSTGNWSSNALVIESANQPTNQPSLALRSQLPTGWLDDWTGDKSPCPPYPDPALDLAWPWSWTLHYPTEGASLQATPLPVSSYAYPNKCQVSYPALKDLLRIRKCYIVLYTSTADMASAFPGPQ